MNECMNKARMKSIYHFKRSFQLFTFVVVVVVVIIISYYWLSENFVQNTRQLKEIVVGVKETSYERRKLKHTLL